MAQRVRMKKNRNTVKGVAIKRTSNKTGYNTITVGNMTIRNNSNSGSSSKKKKKVAVKKRGR